MANKGRVVQVIGAVVDVEFGADYLPDVYTALRVQDAGRDTGRPIDVMLEVQQHLGEGRVRTVALEPTDGMVRGIPATDTGAPIKMLVGKAVLGLVLNVLGRPVDELGPVPAVDHWPIHRHAPTYEEQNPSVEMFETGIKVVDLPRAVHQGRQDRPSGGGRTQGIRMDHTSQPSSAWVSSREANS